MMKTIFFFLLASMSLASSASSQPPLMQNAGGRRTVSLDGQWRAIVDPYQSGYLDYRYRPYADGGFGANKKPTSRGDLVEYDFDGSGQLAVPGDWNTQRPELLFYEGAVWYKKDFDYAAQHARRQFVWFGAANYHAIVFLNGKKLGEHVGGFTPFQFEVTGQLRDKGNFLIVMVDNERHAEGVPTLMTDWWNYGGLTRSVKLIDVADTFVEDYMVQLEKGSETRIAGWVRLDGAHKQQPVTIRIAEAGISKSVTADADGYAQFTVDSHLDLWSPENPKLYDVTIETGEERVADRIGFRSIVASGQTLLLNGQPLHLRGVSVHAESPIHTGRLFAEADARTLLAWAKEMGCNFVRLPHYPHDEVMTRLADEMGLLVWSEVPVYWTISWENAGTLRNAEQQLTEMISRDKNRGSVILWSVANETPLSEPRLKFLSTLAALARELDSTRLVTAALETHRVDENTVMVDDSLGQYLDVVSCNEYIGWYDGMPDKIDRTQWKTAFDKPFVLSEFGADAQAGRHGAAEERWTEEFQADVYRRQVAMFRRIPFLSGTIAWVLVDFRSPRRPLAGIQDYFNRKGLYSDRGERKEAYYVLRDYYRSLAAGGAEAQGETPEWKLAWHDEFDGTMLDAAKWAYVTGGNGFGNQELEYYTDRPQNLYLQNGMLVIEALKGDYRGPDGTSRGFTSARIQTRGKFAQAFGKFEARIKIPCGQGMWPAFWMMGDVAARWPANGEIDIMENIGREPSMVHGTVHGPGYSGAHGIGGSFSLPAGERFCEDFHVFGVEWEPDAIRWYVDGKQYHAVTPASLPAGAKWVYDRPFYLLLNLAVGGAWPGNPDDTSRFPQTMMVDYVRVYGR